jgi:two-component system sensor histidine kinase KdpD
MMRLSSWLDLSARGPSKERFLYPYLTAVVLVTITTLAIALVVKRIDFQNVGIIYLLPVFVVAIRWEFLPAMFTALISVLASSYFFYPPIYSFQAHNWDNQVDLVLFTIVAAATSHLAGRLRRKDEIERLREALIGSVSHELRTPLASILGAASVISEAPGVKSDTRLATLSNVVREEAERLNHDIQNLLDATRISSEGIRPKREWIDVADVVHTAIERRGRNLVAHKIKVHMAGGLPLFRGDAVLIDQALGQVLNNAVKYSPAQSEIAVDVGQDNGSLIISVSDQGAGLSAEEQARWGERFYRGPRYAHTTTGSGLGTWIAKAFIEASGGSVHAESAGPGHGCNVIIMLPIPIQPPQEAESHADE